MSLLATIRQQALTIWPIAAIWNVRQLSTGLVNNTYIIDAAQGDLVLQQLGDVFGNDPQVIVDQAIIAQQLNALGIPAIGPMLTRDGNFSARIDGKVSKLSCFVKNDGSMKGKASARVLCNAAKMLGRMHAALQRIGYVPKFRVPNFHDQAHYLSQLHAASGKSASEKQDRARTMIEMLAKEMPNYTDSLGTHLSIQLIHGDPKIDNFLFRDEEVRGIIDLDTFMVGSVFLDIGDAFRSWMKQADGTFDHRSFPRVFDAYADANPFSELTDKQVLRATKLLSLELATRFLADYFEEKYFGWERSKYVSAAEHNFARAQDMIAYAATII